MRIRALATSTALLAAAFTGGMLVSGHGEADEPTSTVVPASDEPTDTAAADPVAAPTTEPDDEQQQTAAASSDYERRKARCYELAETGTYAQWSVACEGIEPRVPDDLVDEDGFVNNPYGEDDSAYPQHSEEGSSSVDDGSAAIVAEMQRQEQQRRLDDFSRQERERQQAYTDQYNAQIPQGYDYGG